MGTWKICGNVQGKQTSRIRLSLSLFSGMENKAEKELKQCSHMGSDHTFMDGSNERGCFLPLICHLCPYSGLIWQMVLDGEDESAWCSHVWTEEYGIPFDPQHFVVSNPAETPWRRWQVGAISEILGERLPEPSQNPSLLYNSVTLLMPSFSPFLCSVIIFISHTFFDSSLFLCLAYIFLISPLNLPLIWEKNAF